MPTVIFDKVRILAVESNSFNDDAGRLVEYSILMFRYEGKLFQLSIAKDGDIEEMQKAIDTDVELECVLSTYAGSLKPVIKAVTIK